MESDPSSFPAGLAGQGLLLLRGVVTVLLLLCVSIRGNGTVVYALVIGASALILVGLCTRWSALAALAMLLLTAKWQVGPMVVATLALALALTGPGSLSLDARLFGRRNIPVRPRDRDDV